MYITITKPITEKTREKFIFTLLSDMNFIFVGYLLEQKKGKTTWKHLKRWDKYITNYSNIEEPILPPEIREAVLKEAINLIKVKTWKEYKPE